MSCVLSTVILYLMPFLVLIVRRPWPNFLCKGHHTSSVVLVLVLCISVCMEDFCLGFVQ